MMVASPTDPERVGAFMGLFGRRIGRLLGRRGKADGRLRRGGSADAAHLEEFIDTRIGVEAYVEPRTAVTDTTILLVAYDGEWTRRRVDGPHGAEAFARKHAIPLYEAAIVGYPRRMREFNARQHGSGGSRSADSGSADNGSADSGSGS
jgi:hypothetical protein